MLKRLAWIVLLAAAAAGGCMSASGAVRGETLTVPAHTATATPVAPVPPGR